MANVRDILDPEPPAVLYHYTTQNGLLGIVEKKEIWASHTNYLNDQREFQHGVSVIEEEIASMKKDRLFDKHHDHLDKMSSVIKESDSANVCVCSFSEEPDIISQWRAYGGGGGFSIGFRGAFLRTISKNQQFWLVRCLYNETEQQSWMRTLLSDVLDENNQRKLSEAVEEDVKIQGGNLGAYVQRYAPILKHKSFAEEKEWRIISRPLTCKLDRFAFRPGKSMLVPYFKIPLFTDNLKFEIEEIIIGPAPHLTQSRRSLENLLVKHKLGNASVRTTAVPFRNWA